MARRKAQTYGSAILFGTRRAPLGAPITASFRQRASLFRSVAHQSPAEPSASSWQGLLSGPGRSSAAARVLDLRSQACGRRTSSRLIVRLAKRPSSGRGDGECTRGLGGGDKIARWPAVRPVARNPHPHREVRFASAALEPLVDCRVAELLSVSLVRAREPCPCCMRPIDFFFGGWGHVSGIARKASHQSRI